MSLSVESDPASARGREWSVLPQADLDHAFHCVGARWERMRSKRVFVTGGTGFVGKWLLEALIDANRRLNLDCEVCILTRNPEAFVRDAPKLANAAGLTLLAGDVRQLDWSGQKFDFMIHAAVDAITGGNALQTFDTCVEGTRRSLDFAVRADVADFLLVSSGAVYGRQPPELALLDESFSGSPDQLLLSSAYGEGKRAAEWLGSSYAVTHGLHVMTARCFAFIGPYLPLDQHFAIGNFLADALGGRTINILGDGTACRSYLHAADMAAWLWAILFSGRSQTAYNVGGDEIVSIADLAQLVIDATRSESGVYLREIPLAGRLPERYVPDVSRAQHELQLLKPLRLRDAISRTIEWHRTKIRLS